MKLAGGADALEERRPLDFGSTGSNGSSIAGRAGAGHKRRFASVGDGSAKGASFVNARCSVSGQPRME